MPEHLTPDAPFGAIFAGFAALYGSLAAFGPIVLLSWKGRYESATAAAIALDREANRLEAYCKIALSGIDLAIASNNAQFDPSRIFVPERRALATAEESGIFSLVSPSISVLYSTAYDMVDLLEHCCALSPAMSLVDIRSNILLAMRSLAAARSRLRWRARAIKTRLGILNVACYGMAVLGAIGLISLIWVANAVLQNPHAAH